MDVALRIVGDRTPTAVTRRTMFVMSRYYPPSVVSRAPLTASNPARNAVAIAPSKTSRMLETQPPN